MGPLFGLILISAIFLSTVQMKEFCEVFKENDYKISYGFRRITQQNNYLHYLFINQYYWQLTYQDTIIDLTKIVSLDTKNGQKSNWFGNKYSMAFCVWIHAENKCRTVLIQAKDRGIECGNLNVDKLDLDGGPNHNTDPNIRTSYKIGFVPHWDQLKGQLVTFLEVDPVEYNIMRFKSDCSFDDVKDSTAGPEYALLPNSLKNLSKPLELVAVFAQNVSSDKHESWGQEWGGMILVFQGHQSLLYCISYIKYSPNCIQGGLKTLIDCTPISAKPPVGPDDGDDGAGFFRSFWIWIWIALIAIIVLSVLIMGLVWYKRNRTEEPTANPSALSTINTQTGQSTTQTTSKAQSGKSTVQSGKKKTRSPSRSSKTRSPSRSSKTRSPSRSSKTRSPSRSPKSKSPQTTLTPITISTG